MIRVGLRLLFGAGFVAAALHLGLLWLLNFGRFDASDQIGRSDKGNGDG